MNKRKKMTQERRNRIFRRDGGACVHCGTMLNLTIGHIKPVSKGGTNSDWNLQVECYSCNIARGNIDETVD